MRKEIDLTGQRFGRLTVVSKSTKRDKSRNIYWNCLCDCSNFCIVSGKNLRFKTTKSCGCLQKSKASIALKRYNSSEKFKERKSTIQENSKGQGLFEGTCIAKLRSKNLRSNNTSGVKGVRFISRVHLWESYITIKGKYHYLGLYVEKEDAAKARKTAEEIYFEPVIEEYNRQFER